MENATQKPNDQNGFPWGELVWALGIQKLLHFHIKRNQIRLEHLSPDVSEGGGFQHVPMERVLRGDLELDEEIISFDRYVENEISAPHEELEKFVQKEKARPLSEYLHC